MKSNAPSFIAVTASSTEPNAVSKITGIVASTCFDRAQDVESGRAGQLQIREDEQVAARADFLDGGGAVGGFVDGVAGALERFAQHRAQLVLVFDEKKGFHVILFLSRNQEACGNAPYLCGEGKYRVGLCGQPSRITSRSGK